MKHSTNFILKVGVQFIKLQKLNSLLRIIYSFFIIPNSKAHHQWNGGKPLWISFSLVVCFGLW